jgi:hypothetical protein
MSSDREDAAAAAGADDAAVAADAGGEDEDEDEDDAGGAASAAASARRRKGRAVLSAAKLEKLQARYDKRGVVYISRVPPFMKPAKLRHLLEQHGEVLRLYLAAEGACACAKERVPSGRRRGAAFFLCLCCCWWLTRVRAQTRRRACGARRRAATAARSSRKGAPPQQAARARACETRECAASRGGRTRVRAHAAAPLPLAAGWSSRTRRWPSAPRRC